MCKYKNLKPNQWRIMLFLDNQKTLIDIQEKQGQKIEPIKTKDRYNVSELSRELNIDRHHLTRYLGELDKLGLVNLYRCKGRLEVIL